MLDRFRLLLLYVIPNRLRALDLAVKGPFLPLLERSKCELMLRMYREAEEAVRREIGGAGKG